MRPGARSAPADAVAVLDRGEDLGGSASPLLNRHWHRVGDGIRAVLADAPRQLVEEERVAFRPVDAMLDPRHDAWTPGTAVVRSRVK